MNPKKSRERKGRVWALALSMGTAFGCRPSSEADSATRPSAFTGSAASVEGCEVVAAGPPAANPDPNGPYYHQVVFARTADGITLTGAQQVLDHASVPDGVLGRDGLIYVYYVNGEDGSVWVARMSGDLALPIGPISLNGVERPAGVVDPDATALADGRVRLVYLSGFGPPASSRERAMCIADSTDGQHFKVLGQAIRFSANEQATDPSIAQLQDFSWLMAISLGQRTILARSGDGLVFARGETLSYGGVPELASLPDNRVRLYVCARGIQSYVSHDGGSSWQKEATVVAPGAGGHRIVCDPSYVLGGNAFIYKTANGSH